MIILCLLGFAEIIFLTVMILKSIHDLYKYKTKDKIKMKFESFKYFYDVSPDRWSLEDDYVVFKAEYKVNGSVTDIRWGTYAPTCKYIKFRFGLIGGFKYKLWKFMKDRNDKMIANNEDYQKVLDIIADDIRIAKNESFNASMKKE